MSRPLRIGIICGEPSGDILGASLMDHLLSASDRPIVFEGIGGPRMIARGFVSHFPMESLSVMGLVEVLGRVRVIHSFWQGHRTHFLQNPPDVVVGIDAPDFNLPVEIQFKAAGIRTVHYVSPSVWAWRQKRVFKVQRATCRVLTLLPFEAAFYERFNIPVTFVGHPLADEVPLASPQDEARARLGVRDDAGQPVVAVLPGSRVGEVNRLMPVMLETMAIVQDRHPDTVFLVPAANKSRRNQIEQHIEAFGKTLNIRVLDGESQAAMRASDAILIASGTATLEAMLCKRPMVVVYKLAPLTWWLAKRLVKTKYVSLPNLIADAPLVPELLQDDANPDTMSRALLHWLDSPGDSEKLVNRFHEIHSSIRRNAGARAAAAVLEVINEPAPNAG
jgi:lipid-A-disaccharide synthase